MTISTANQLPSDLVEQGWCQGALALDSHGNVVSPYGLQAVKWCAEAAALVVYGYCPKYLEWNNAMIEEIGQSVFMWNDNPRRNKAEVLCVMRRVEVNERQNKA